MSTVRFDDFLRLGERDFSSHRVVAFVGESGSGKSTAIGFLREQHPHFRDREVLVIDEAGAAELPRLWRPLACGATLLLASHLPVWVVRAALPCTGVAVFRTDRDHGKILRYLRAQEIEASAHAVDAYVRRFGATYTDVDLILERFPGCSFDAALARFERFCRLKRSTSHAATARAIRT